MKTSFSPELKFITWTKFDLNPKDDDCLGAIPPHIGIEVQLIELYFMLLDTVNILYKFHHGLWVVVFFLQQMISFPFRLPMLWDYLVFPMILSAPLTWITE